MSGLFFPIFLNLSERSVLVVGAGRVAAGKILQLLQYGARVTIIAPDVHPEVQSCRTQFSDQIILHQREATPDDLPGYALILLATDNSGLHAQLADTARRLGIWCNSVDEPGHCDFYTCSVIQQGPLCVAIGTYGAAPGLSAAIRKVIQALLPDADLSLWKQLIHIRKALKSTIPDPGRRSRILKEVFSTLEAFYFGLPHSTRSGIQ